ncbi:MAG: RIP metalloprotease [Mycobacteriaceae bacterium]|nr:RIP metalloprotease [Mycobacteriaceae bacterium]
MMFVVGIVLFALAILLSVALHECGHMWVARATGMKVRRYFVGFGPTLWSTQRPNKLGSTEYGVKAIPLGGFCDIAGMTAVEELRPEDEPYAMYKQKTWKRVAVLFAGPAMNFIIGLVLIYAIAITWGLPNLRPPTTAIVGETSCVIVQSPDVFGNLRDLKPIAEACHKNGALLIAEVGAIGIGAAQLAPTHYNVLSAIPGTFAFSGDLAVELGKSLAAIPTKVGALVHAIGGGERDPETPISVVGASIIGGDTVDQGLWVAFWFFLAQLNFVLGAVNLVPLLPFDGGHIMVAVYEKIRNMIRSLRGVAPAAPVDYQKLMPVTYVILFVVVGYMLLTVTADLVNPIRLFQ